MPPPAAGTQVFWPTFAIENFNAAGCPCVTFNGASTMPTQREVSAPGIGDALRMRTTLAQAVPKGPVVVFAMWNRRCASFCVPPAIKRRFQVAVSPGATGPDTGSDPLG